MSIASDVQRLQLDAVVTLFEIDMTRQGGGVYRFVPGTVDGAPVRWRGQPYISAPIKAEGFERNGKGPFPTPTLSCEAIDLVVASVIAFDDLRGGRVIRWRTFRKYLDGMPAANPNVFFPLDIYRIDRKSRHNTGEGIIEWQLSSDIDQQGKKIPGRVMTRDFCPWRYRRWTGAGFDYGEVECRYNGTRYFLANGAATANPSQDACGKKLSDCKKRFGDGATLPFGGFPGIGRNRL